MRVKITDDMLTEEGLRKLLSDVWNLGQTYWRQADSEFASDNRRSDDTYKKYRAIVDESCERLADAARRTTPDREAITKLAEINGQLREQIERYQAVCAAAYQLVGVVDGPLRFLDALSNAANGEPMSTEDALNLLPVTLDECDSFRTVPTSDKGGA